MEEKILQEIKKLVKDRFNKEVNVDTVLSETGIDSLSLLDLVVDAESKYGVTISDEELIGMKTVQDIIDAIKTKV